MVRSPLPPWKASLEPSGDQAGKLALFVRLWRPEPSALITEMPTPGKAICVPSGDQAGKLALFVRLWRPEPSALITEMPTPEKAICVPSGDQAGSQPNPLVRLRTPEPSAF